MQQELDPSTALVVFDCADHAEGMPDAKGMCGTFLWLVMVGMVRCQFDNPYLAARAILRPIPHKMHSEMWLLRCY